MTSKNEKTQKKYPRNAKKIIIINIAETKKSRIEVDMK